MLEQRFHARDVYKADLFKGKTILLTGGGTGIGRLIADAFAELGANLVLSARKLERLQSAQAEIISDWGTEVLALQCDISDPASVKKMVSDAFNWKDIDILVNNAGANSLRPSEHITPIRWKKIVDTVLNGTFYVSREAALRWINASKPGNIINIASTTGATGSPHMAPSGAAKAGMLNMSRTLGSEWGQYGIRVNDVSPGPVYTKGSFDRLWLNDEVIDYIQSRVPLGRFPYPKDVVGAVIFLASPAAEFLTGASIAVDGGEALKQGFGEFVDFSKEKKRRVKDDNDSEQRSKGPLF